MVRPKAQHPQPPFNALPSLVGQLRQPTHRSMSVYHHPLCRQGDSRESSMRRGLYLPKDYPLNSLLAGCNQGRPPHWEWPFPSMPRHLREIPPVARRARPMSAHPTPVPGCTYPEKKITESLSIPTHTMHTRAAPNGSKEACNFWSTKMGMRLSGLAGTNILNRPKIFLSATIVVDLALTQLPIQKSAKIAGSNPQSLGSVTY